RDDRRGEAGGWNGRAPAVLGLPRRRRRRRRLGGRRQSRLWRVTRLGRRTRTLSEQDLAPRSRRGSAFHQLAEDGPEQARTRLLCRSPAGENLRELAEHLRRAMPGRHLGDHLAVVGGRAEYLRLERNERERLVLERLGEIGGFDLRTLRHPDLV